MRYLAKDTLWKPPFSYLWTALGGIPEAIAMPMHSGRATRKTTTEPSRSRPNRPWEK